MDNVTFIEIQGLGSTETHAIIEHADGSQTAMLKATYDEQIKANEAKTL
jgi:hypothetical protein